MMTKEGSTKIVNFMTPGQGFFQNGFDLIIHNVKIHYFFNPNEYIRQTNYIVIITKEGSYKIVNFMTPGAGVLVLEIAI